MLVSLDQNSAALSLLLLLALGILTVEVCRRDRLGSPQTEPEFLFQGKRQIHSLASNVGALFSLTYFFGGAFVYGFFFGVWYLVASLLILGVLLVVLVRMVGKLDASEGSADGPVAASNLLLDYLRARLPSQAFRSLLRIYALVYFLLLVEELAISRLVIAKLLPPHPVFPTLALSLVCLVVYAYLAYGGFRAVLNSDFVQMIVVGGLLLSLVFLLLKASPGIQAKLSSRTELDGGGVATLLFVVVFGVSWFAAGIDFFSRLNFAPRPGSSLRKQRRTFVVLSLVLTFLVLLVGIVYGAQLRGEIQGIERPSEYVESTIHHFFSKDRPVITIFFVGGIFCMIFTTIDTLLLTLLQLGQYYPARILSRSNLSKLLFVAVFLSCLLDFDALSAFGIFAGSLMIIPAAAVLQGFSPRLRPLAASSVRPLELSLVSSGALFAVFFPKLKLAFEHHFLIAGGVLTLTIFFLAVAALGLKVDRVPT